MLSKENIRLQLNCLREKHIEVICSLNGKTNEKDGFTYELKESQVDGCQLITLNVNAKQTIFDDVVNLSLEKTIRFYLPVAEKPEKITALYLFKDWWTRPVFVDKYQDIPSRTQICYFKYPNKVVCFIPMIGTEFKSFLNGGTETELCIDMFSSLAGQGKVDNEPVCLISEAPTYLEAVHRAFSYLAKLNNILPREKRRYPEVFEYLGWCSWDAMKTDVNEKGIREKAEEFRNKKVPVRWMLIDDGWFPAKDAMISGFTPDTNKFPTGFKQMIEDIKKNGRVQWFGVWHAFMGYWSGVLPESDLAKQEEKYLYKTPKGYLVPSPKKGNKFYYHFNQSLRKEGIDFLKVDGQSSTYIYFEGNIPTPVAARSLNRELELGASVMDGVIINCMGMALENVLGRPTSAISRNSDDFFPEQENGFAEHLLQNAFNSTYHDEIYRCDWDMFWTKHQYAVKHSMIRAISGGPIYFSDKVGATMPDILVPLVYSDGRILRMNRSAKPTEDSLFNDPSKEGTLKIHNVGSWGEKYNNKGAIMAAYNLTEKKQSVSFKVLDIPDIEKVDRYWIYDYLKKKVCSVSSNDSFKDEIDAAGYGWYLILPETQNLTCFGLINKYVSFKAVENIVESSNSQVVVLHEIGVVGWATKKAVKKVTVNGIDMTMDIKSIGEFHTIELAEKDTKEVVIFEW